MPWEDVSRYVAEGQRSRRLLAPDEATLVGESFAELDDDPQQPFDPEWIDDRLRYWDYVSRACAPDRPARKVQTLETMNGPIDAIFPTDLTMISYMDSSGFIKNFTQAQDPCLQPHLRGMQGTFVEAFSMLTATKLFPCSVTPSCRRTTSSSSPALCTSPARNAIPAARVMAGCERRRRTRSSGGARLAAAATRTTTGGITSGTASCRY